MDLDEVPRVSDVLGALDGRWYCVRNRCHRYEPCAQVAVLRDALAGPKIVNNCLRDYSALQLDALQIQTNYERKALSFFHFNI